MRLAPSTWSENVFRAPPRNETREFRGRPSARRPHPESRSQPRTQTLDDTAQTRPSFQYQLEIFSHQRGDASDAGMHARDEVSIPRPQSPGRGAEDRGGSGAAMCGLVDRKNGRAPSSFMQPRRQFDIFVVCKKSRIENAIAKRGSAKERRCRGDSPRRRGAAADRKPRSPPPATSPPSLITPPLRRPP